MTPEKEITDFNPSQAEKADPTATSFPSFQIGQIIINNFKETEEPKPEPEQKSEPKPKEEDTFAFPDGGWVCSTC